MKTRCFILASFLTMSFTLALYGQAPQLINYQGNLNQDGSPADGTFNITFAIYDSASDGTQLWSEQQSVNMSNGVFNVLLGSSVAFPIDLFTGTGDRYLGIKVENDSEMTQRFRFTSVAYSLNAKAVSSGTPNSNIFTTDGNVGIGTTNPNFALQVGDGTLAPNIDLVGTPQIQISSTTNADAISYYLAIPEGTNNRRAELFLDDSGGTWGLSSTASTGIPDFVIRDSGAERLRVKSGSGNVGIGTSAPDSPLHLEAAISGTLLHLKRSDASPVNFWITGNSQNAKITSDRPIELRSGATGPGDGNLGIHIDPSGNVGIGTTGPDSKLHVLGTLELGQDGIVGGNLRSDGNLIYDADYSSPGSGDHIFQIGSVTKMVLDNNGNVGIGTTSPSFPLEMASGAHVTAGGVWTDASSREYKEDIENLPPDDAIETLENLNPVTFRYKTEKDFHVGFIAEDVPEMVATPDRKSLSPMDIVAVLTKVVQEQQKTISELKARVEALEVNK